MKIVQIILKAKALLVLIIAILSTSGYAQKIYEGASAKQFFSNADMVRTSQYSTLPSYIRFRSGSEIDFDDFKNWTKSSFKLSTGMDFELKNVETDQIGSKHYRYQQTYQGIKIEHAIWIVHVKNDKIHSMNGLIYKTLPNAGAASHSESAALSAALNYINADTYKWELPIEEEFIKRQTGDPSATYFPAGEIVYMSEGANFGVTTFKLAYKFNIYAHAPVSRSEVYVDATNGKILFENEVFHHADTPGTAQTAYSGSRPIIADSFGGGFRLRDGSRGLGVNTYDMNQGTTYGSAVDFTDSDNIWNNANAQLDQYATDAHWGAEMTYDYYLMDHARNSIDGAGFALNSYVHYDNNYANAFWDGEKMTYGDGNGTWDPLTALDIAGHEVTHGLTTFTAGLIYNAESGALNESFSDIFGTSIENFARPTNWNWTIGEDIGSALRSMSNPGAYGDPDTYFGSNWASLTGGDNGGVHTNSGVQNFWYYLLVNGGSGTNDNADVYSVSGLGFDDASDIAFRNLTVYLTPSSDYADARFYAIQSAIDLFGGCTPQVEACTNAWYAVGVGPAYVATVIANFSSPVTTGCSAPHTFNFTNSSNNGTTYTWNFGDGGTSNLLNPSHIYTTVGSFTVQLIADGGLCGIDTATFVNYITIDTSLACIVNLPNSGTGPTQSSCDGSLFDSGGSGNNYGGNEDAQITIAPLGAASVNLNFVLFDVEPGQSGGCNYDYLEIHDGPSTSDPLIGTYCNNNIPPNLTSTANALTIVFHSDGGLELPGFQIDWTCNLPTLPPVADFTSDTDTTCNGTISFFDTSTEYPSQWSWDFGDGSNANTQNPNHTYTTSGDYTVILTATNLNGSDAETKIAYVHVDLPAAPSVIDESICENNTANLSASGTGGTLDWYDAAVGGNLVNTGNSFTSPTLSTTTSYFVEEIFPGTNFGAGPSDNTFGGGGFFNGNQHLIFDCTSPVTLSTVRVYANGAGNRTIELRDNTGTVLQSAVVNIPDGEQVVTLNFNIPVGTNLQLGTQANSNQDLYRNNAGPSFPYTSSGGEISITSSSPGLSYYYFFYDWVLTTEGCISERAEVTATVSPQQDATINSVSPLCASDAAVNLTAADLGGTWSGTGVIGTQFDPSVAGLGTHVVYYSITGLCGDIDSTTISVSNSYDATIQPSNVLCLGDAPTILSAQDAGGTWSGTGISNSTTGEFDPTLAGIGTHSVTYVITGSCGDTDTKDIVVEEAQDATVETAGPFCKYETAQQLSSTTTGGTWTATCGACIDATTGIFDPGIAGAGTWLITYSFGGNCPSSSVTSIDVDECLSLEESSADWALIYPNPSNGTFEIQVNTTGDWNYEVLDITGKSIVQNQTQNGTDKITVQLALSSGTYVLKIFSFQSNTYLIKRIIIN